MVDNEPLWEDLYLRQLWISDSNQFPFPTTYSVTRNNPCCNKERKISQDTTDCKFRLKLICSWFGIAC